MAVASDSVDDIPAVTQDAQQTFGPGITVLDDDTEHGIRISFRQ